MQETLRRGILGALNTVTLQKMLQNTASPQEKSIEHHHRSHHQTLYKGLHLIILFKIIHSQGQNHGYPTDAFGSFLPKLCHWKINENDCQVASKSYCCLAGTRTFPGSHLSKNYGNRKIANNFVSPYTVDFKMQTSYTVRLEITAGWDFFHRKTA